MGLGDRLAQASNKRYREGVVLHQWNHFALSRFPYRFARDILNAVISWRLLASSILPTCAGWFDALAVESGTAGAR